MATMLHNILYNILFVLQMIITYKNKNVYFI